MTGHPARTQIKIGCRASVETKADQGTGRLTGGIVKEILTRGDSHPHGIKVRLMDGQVGRVKVVGHADPGKAAGDRTRGTTGHGLARASAPPGRGGRGRPQDNN